MPMFDNSSVLARDCHHDQRERSSSMSEQGEESREKEPMGRESDWVVVKIKAKDTEEANIPSRRTTHPSPHPVHARGRVVIRHGVANGADEWFVAMERRPWEFPPK